jgi:hypothetical protein
LQASAQNKQYMDQSKNICLGPGGARKSNLILEKWGNVVFKKRVHAMLPFVLFFFSFPRALS